MSALDALTAALTDALAAGLRIPCAGRREWTSDDLEVLTEAAQACGGCPVIDACRSAALEVQPTAGAWAGHVLAAKNWSTRTALLNALHEDHEEMTA